MDNYLGIDVGGMSIKAGIVTAGGKILFKTAEKVINGDAQKCLISAVDNTISFAKKENLKISSAGIGLPCVFDKKSGVVAYGNNLDFKGLNVKKIFRERYGLGITLANDAAAAALGEYRFGAAKGYANSVLITLGTGVGCGIILGGKIIESNSSAVGEFGQTVIVPDGRKCTCGKRGCFEAYCSMTALKNDVYREMQKNKKSLLWQRIKPNEFDGRAFFDCIDKDETAARIYARFIKYLSLGVLNVANFLRPDIILLGGAVSAQGDRLIVPIQRFLDENLFAKEYTKGIPVKAAQNGNDAGILGAAALAMLKLSER